MADTTTKPMPRQPDPEGLRVARRVARWHIGDSEWADLIVDAYLCPKRAEAQLRADMSEGD